MEINMVLDCGHKFALSLPCYDFSGGNLIFGCVECGRRYRIREGGEVSPYDGKAWRFLAIHY